MTDDVLPPQLQCMPHAMCVCTSRRGLSRSGVSVLSCSQEGCSPALCAQPSFPIPCSSLRWAEVETVQSRPRAWLFAPRWPQLCSGCQSPLVKHAFAGSSEQQSANTPGGCAGMLGRGNWLQRRTGRPRQAGRRRGSDILCGLGHSTTPPAQDHVACSHVAPCRTYQCNMQPCRTYK